ncbi:MAG: hypothetical protein FH756_02895 [Firmicutes bacterium]|nr:hypothetical protein [Bacillota bacterium]
MGVPKFDLPDEDIKKWLNHIALICLSDEFQKLKTELESMYGQYNMEDVGLTAFQDALYTFLAEEDDERTTQSKVY